MNIKITMPWPQYHCYLNGIVTSIPYKRSFYYYNFHVICNQSDIWSWLLNCSTEYPCIVLQWSDLDHCCYGDKCVVLHEYNPCHVYNILASQYFFKFWITHHLIAISTVCYFKINWRKWKVVITQNLFGQYWTVFG